MANGKIRKSFFPYFLNFLKIYIHVIYSRYLSGTGSTPVKIIV